MVVACSKDYAAGALEECDNQILMLDANKERSFIDFVNKMQLSQCVIQAFARSKLSLDYALDNR